MPKTHASEINRIEDIQEGAHPTPESQQELMSVDALTYLDAVKSRENEGTYIYSDFLDIMRDYTSRS